MKKIFAIAAVACAAMLVSCCGNETKVTMGDESKLDTLSYAIGANIGQGVSYQMSDIPFNLEKVTEGIKEGAFDKASITHEEAIETLRNYFMTTRNERAREIAAKRKEADSIRLAQGDSTVVEYPKADEAMFATEEERNEISYAFGMDIGTNLAANNLPIQVYWVGQALTDSFNKSSKMNEMEVNGYLQHYFTVVVPAQNAEASAEWLEKIEKKSGVKKTESGLLYKVVKAGDEAVKATDDRDVVSVHYTGRTREGKVFDTSIFANRPKEIQEMILKQNPAAAEEDQPVEFPLNRVIPGWTEGMKLVGKGGTIILWIPAELAYGERGAGRDIGPNEALEFEVELIDVKPYVEPTPAEEPATEEAAE
ncbi:MAG: FKBP-type peptidyl-prolyl cis-trans isomerase N-terminal domain-containing protein [Rikenellaceae bacterium]|nr:FKBP-type peptidyl-prolyl cis-trans isomerase N-terminal domain-containing protein [Rikenellaceae bacterium]